MSSFKLKGVVHPEDNNVWPCKYKINVINRITKQKNNKPKDD